MSSAAITTHEVPSCREAVLLRFPEQAPVAIPVCGVKDNANVHHDVDETTIWSHEGSKKLSFLIEAQTHGSPGLDDSGFDGFIPGLVEPSLPGGPEDEPEIVNICIVLALFDQE